MTINSIAQNIWNTLFAGSPPAVNSEFKDYHCFAIADAPWEKGYDINQDGWFGVDDLKARMVRAKGLSPIDENLESLNKACRKTQMNDIPEKASWYLREVVNEFKAEKLQTREAIARVDKIKNNAVQELESYRKEFKDHKMMGISNCEVLDLVSQAKEVINGEQKGHFGVGIRMKPAEVLSQRGHSIIDVYPKGLATGSLRRGDVITAIDGKKIGSAELPDGRDPATGLAYGFGGWYNSSVTFAVVREENGELKQFKVTLPRTTWAAEPTNCEETPHNWDGTEEFLESSGCSASPAALSPRGPIDGLWDLGGDLGEWIYDVTH